MTKIVTAHVELSDGSDFIAEIANLTPRSVFIATPRVLPFREPVTVTFFSVSVLGQVAFLSRAEPKGLVIVFEAKPDVRARIAALATDVRVIEQFEVPTIPPAAITAPQALPLGTAAIPEVPILPPEEAIEDASRTMPTNVPVIQFDRAKTAKASPKKAGAVSGRRRAQTTKVDMPAIGGTALDVPEMLADGLVHFGSRAQYRSQHETNISNGAIVVRAKPLPNGTVRKLKLSIPEAGEYELTAKVAFSTDDSVGFLIDGFDRHARALSALALL